MFESTKFDQQNNVLTRYANLLKFCVFALDCTRSQRKSLTYELGVDTQDRQPTHKYLNFDKIHLHPKKNQDYFWHLALTICKTEW